MPGKHLFEYATVRFVPCVERGEFINIGVLLFCQPQGFLKGMYHVDSKRMKAFYPDADPEFIETCLNSFSRICAGKQDGGPIGQLPAATRFRWLTAQRSTIIQTSPVHSGLCEDPSATLEKLFRELVCWE